MMCKTAQKIPHFHPFLSLQSLSNIKASRIFTRLPGIWCWTDTLTTVCCRLPLLNNTWKLPLISSTLYCARFFCNTLKIPQSKIQTRSTSTKKTSFLLLQNASKFIKPGAIIFHHMRYTKTPNKTRRVDREILVSWPITRCVWINGPIKWFVMLEEGKEWWKKRKKEFCFLIMDCCCWLKIWSMLSVFLASISPVSLGFCC